MKTCNRCGANQGPELVRTYIIQTKVRGEEQIDICQVCLVTIVDAMFSFGLLNMQDLYKWCNKEIVTGELLIKHLDKRTVVLSNK